MIIATGLADEEHYNHLTQQLVNDFDQRLKTVVLFGFRAQGEAEERSDHDLLLVIDGVPLRINTIAKTPVEVACNLTPLLLDRCVDGVGLSGQDYFDPY